MRSGSDRVRGSPAAAIRKSPPTSSGWPPLARNTAGSPLARALSSAFDDPEDVADALDRVVAELDERQATIRVTPMNKITDRYLEVLRG